MQDHLGPWDLHFIKLDKGPLGNVHTKFPAYKPSNSEEEDFLIFSMYFYGLNIGLPGAGAILDPGTFIWTKLVRDHKAKLHTKFQASKPSGSEEEDFWIFFYVFLWFEPMTPWGTTILDPHLNKLGKGPLGNASYWISSIKAKQFWRRRFLIFFYVFLWLEHTTPGQKPSWTLGPTFEQNW